MKKQIAKLVALLLFASVALSSCSIEYRERHRHHDNDRRDNDRHDNDRRDNDRRDRDNNH